VPSVPDTSLRLTGVSKPTCAFPDPMPIELHTIARWELSHWSTPLSAVVTNLSCSLPATTKGSLTSTHAGTVRLHLPRTTLKFVQALIVRAPHTASCIPEEGQYKEGNQPMPSYRRCQYFYLNFTDGVPR
jgi:hypothetical protein